MFRYLYDLLKYILSEVFEYIEEIAETIISFFKREWKRIAIYAGVGMLIGIYFC